MNEISKAASAFGKMGGRANIKKNGADQMRKIANKRWAQEKQKNHSDSDSDINLSCDNCAVDNSEKPV